VFRVSNGGGKETSTLLRILLQFTIMGGNNGRGGDETDRVLTYKEACRKKKKLEGAKKVLSLSSVVLLS